MVDGFFDRVFLDEKVKGTSKTHSQQHFSGKVL